MESLDLWLDALAHALLHLLWQGAAIGVLYALLRPQLRSASAQLALGHAALLGMALCLPVTVLVLMPWGGQGGGGSLVTAAPSVLAASTQRASDLDWTAFTLAAWAAGVLLLGLRATGRWWMLHRLCRAALPASEAVQQAAARIARGMGISRAVELRTTLRLTTPIVVGWLRPMVLLPSSIVMRMPQAQLELLIAHELAHVRRWDLLANLLQTVVEIVLFYHPVVHWISRRVREDRELCCDDLVSERFGQPVMYARALLALAEAGQQPAPPFAAAAAGGVLLPRIERILAPPAAPRRRRDRAGAVLLVAAALALVAALQWSERGRPGPVPLPLPVPLQALAQPLELTLPALAQLAGASRTLRPAIPRFTTPDEAEPRLRPPALAIERAPVPVPAATSDFARAQVERALPAPPEFTAAPIPAPAPRLLAYRAPDYPKNALSRGIEGDVTVAFSISPEGRVVDIEVLSISPARELAFGSATREAMQHWRFESASGAEGRQSRVIEFRLDGQSADGRCAVQTGSHFCRDGA